jgi:DEAD/DEAH box helicase domain-containing protein
LRSLLTARSISCCTIRRGPADDQSVILKKQVVNGKPGYYLRIGDHVWYIEPQATLGKLQGVEEASRADFMFWPAREQQEILPVAVFTDGYLHHRYRIGQDMAQRMAIAQSKRYLAWSLTWKDVENRYRSRGDYFRDYLNPDAFSNPQRYTQFIKHYGTEALRAALREDSFSWLLRYLARPDRELWTRYAFVHGLLYIDGPGFKAPSQVDQWSRTLKSCVTDEITELIDTFPDTSLYGLYEPGDDNSLLTLQVAVEAEAVNKGDETGMVVTCCLHDDTGHQEFREFEASWNGYLRLYNLFQFLSQAFFVTTQGKGEGVYRDLELTKKAITPATTPLAEDPWAEIRELTEPALHPLLDLLTEREWPVPEPGYELVDDQGEVVGSAELAWEGLKMAIMREDELDNASAFENLGWRVFPLSEVLARISQQDSGFWDKLAKQVGRSPAEA